MQEAKYDSKPTLFINFFHCILAKNISNTTSSLWDLSSDFCYSKDNLQIKTVFAKTAKISAIYA